MSAFIEDDETVVAALGAPLCEIGKGKNSVGDAVVITDKRLYFSGTNGTEKYTNKTIDPEAVYCFSYGIITRPVLLMLALFFLIAGLGMAGISIAASKMSILEFKTISEVLLAFIFGGAGLLFFMLFFMIYVNTRVATVIMEYGTKDLTIVIKKAKASDVERFNVELFRLKDRLKQKSNVKQGDSLSYPPTGSQTLPKTNSNTDPYSMTAPKTRQNTKANDAFKSTYMQGTTIYSSQTAPKQSMTQAMPNQYMNMQSNPRLTPQQILQMNQPVIDTQIHVSKKVKRKKALLQIEPEEIMSINMDINKLN